MESREYTIQDLSDLTGVPRRTIHFYTQQGILPPPQSAGLGARYTELHLLRLRAVPTLRAQGLRLDDIRARLHGLDAAETRAILEPALAEALNPKRVPAPRPPMDVREESPVYWLPSLGVPDLPAPPAAEPPLPGGQPYLHYPLPGGLFLAAPANLDGASQRKLAELLQAARRIFEGQG